MIKITNSKFLNLDDINVRFIRASGPGGQHVNKVESGVQIKFDGKNCDFIDSDMFNRLRQLAGSKMTAEGIIVITSSETRSQTRNREDATERLVELLKKSAIKRRLRKKTRPSLASKKRRIEGKKRNSALKKMRSKRIID